ncbi:MAG: hypothetical protein ACLS4A_01775 [Oscillospiraceae bacterium]
MYSNQANRLADELIISDDALNELDGSRSATIRIGTKP